MNLEDLANLGDVSKFDISRIRKSTQMSMRSHLNLIRYNGINLTRDYVQNNDMNDMLDTLKTRKGEFLKPEYKVQVAATLRRLYGTEMSIDVNAYRNDVQRNKPHAENYDMMEKIKKMINHAAAYMRTVESENSFGNSLTSYEAALAVLMSCATSHRINELHQLTIQNLKDILLHKPIFVHTKGHKSSTTRCDIVPNKLLVSCIKFIMENRERVLQGARIHERSNRYPDYTEARIAADNVFITSVSQLRRSVKQLAVSFSLDIENLGFNKFRKYITTVLVDGGGHSLAQFINAHSNVDTTISNYDVGTKITMERTMKDLLNDVSTPRLTNEPPSTAITTMTTKRQNDFQKTRQPRVNGTNDTDKSQNDRIRAVENDVETTTNMQTNSKLLVPKPQTYIVRRKNSYELPATPYSPSMFAKSTDDYDDAMDFE